MNSERFGEVIKFIETEIADGTFPGAGMVVTQHGKKVFENFWGTYCSPHRRSDMLNERVVHMLYSFSKAISATVIVLARQKGLIDYDVAISTYIPEYSGGWKNNTTIRHLLTHAAGIPNCPSFAAYSDDEWLRCLQSCCDEEVQWEPGSRTTYHWASGLFLAAEAVRRVMHGTSWETICREWLFEPIGAASLTFLVPNTELVALTPQPKALPYPIDSTHFTGLGHPGAGCFGCLEDVTKVLQLHLDGGLWKGKVIINPDEIAEMHRIQYAALITEALNNGSPSAHEPWGLGWLIKHHLSNHWFGLGELTSMETFGHAGIDTVLSVGDPKRNLAIAFITTDAPNPSGDNTHRIRNKVTDLVVEALE